MSRNYRDEDGVCVSCGAAPQFVHDPHCPAVTDIIGAPVLLPTPSEKMTAEDIAALDDVVRDGHALYASAYELTFGKNADCDFYRDVYLQAGSTSAEVLTARLAMFAKLATNLLSSLQREADELREFARGWHSIVEAVSTVLELPTPEGPTAAANIIAKFDAAKIAIGETNDQ